ncbi:MAG TPA: hypothetical protein PK747_02435 [Acidobacteriota bacterium]|nr:hypothetical protein [Acidobacteriota bacterium]
MCIIRFNPTTMATMSSLFLIMAGCNAVKRIDNTFYLKGNFVCEKRIYKASDAVNVPSDQVLNEMADNAGKIMAEALDIMEKENGFSLMTADINESQEALDNWLNLTRPGQERLGFLLKNHPEIYCLSLKLCNRKISEESVHIPKSLRYFNMMWIYDPGKNCCHIIAFPQDCLVSLYGGSTGSESKQSMTVNVENIPESFAFRLKSGKYPDFVDEGIKKEPNNLTLLETIIQYHDTVRFGGDSSKGSLISFTSNLKHKGLGFRADGIRLYSLYGDTSSSNLATKPSCPTDIYGNTWCICSEVPLPGR